MARARRKRPHPRCPRVLPLSLSGSDAVGDDIVHQGAWDVDRAPGYAGAREVALPLDERDGCVPAFDAQHCVDPVQGVESGDEIGGDALRLPALERLHPRFAVGFYSCSGPRHGDDRAKARKRRNVHELDQHGQDVRIQSGKGHSRMSRSIIKRVFFVLHIFGVIV